MTKFFLYAKIVIMKTVLLKKKLKISILSVLGALCLSFALILSMPKTLAYGVNANGTSAILPSCDIEQKSLVTPIDAFSDGNVTAIIESFNQTLLIYTEGVGYNATDIVGTSFKQVKKLADNLLLVSDNGHINIVNTLDYSRTRFDFDTPEHSFGGNFFDLNENYLVTNYSAKADIYRLENNQIIEKTYSIDIASETPIAINSSNEIFYVYGQGTNYSIYKQTIGNTADKVTFTQTFSVKPSQIIANEQFVYLIVGDDICRFNADGTDFTTLTVNGDDKFDLGNLISPTGISFKGDNLLITDATIGAVQEFTISEDALNFTGFAIAKGKTAYNRISTTAKDIESLNEKIAVLDDDKLTVIKADSTFNPYEKNSFLNYFASDLNGVMPTSFALGFTSAGLIYPDNTFAILSFNKNAHSFASELDGTLTLKDVCYRNGFYYLLATDGQDSKVYKINEKDASVLTVTDFTAIVGEILTVDVKGNIYLANATDVFKNDTISIAQRGSITKLSTDLAGRLYGNDGDKFYLFNSIDGTFSELSLTLSAKTFAMDFDSKKVYYLSADDESVYFTESVNNLGIDSLSIPTDYKVTALQSDDTVIKPYTKEEGKNAFYVDASGENFKYIKTDLGGADYLYICDVATGIDGFSLGAFATPSGTVIIDMADVTANAPVFNDAPQKAYITTDSNAYYLPIISEHSLYSIVDDLDNLVKIRMHKGTVISPVSKTTFLGKEFYLATFNYNGALRTAYFPVAFTVEVPYVESGYQTYSLEKVGAVTVYAENSFETKLDTLSEDAIVRVYSVNNGVALIGFANENGDLVTGYIDASAIKNAPKIAVRNIILVVIVIASISITSSYFILKKKKKS